MNKLEKKWEERIIGLVISGLGLITYFFIIPREVPLPTRHAGGSLSPAFLPKWAALLLIFFGLFLIASTFFSEYRKTTSKIYWKEIAAIGFTIGYTYLIEVLGYLLATPIVLVLFLLLLGIRSWKILLLVITTVPISIYFFFTRVMRVSLPGGFGF